MIRERLNKNPVPIELPIGKEDDFKGVIDLFEMKAYIYNDEMGIDVTVTDIPEDMVEKAEEHREMMIESICETDDELILKF